MPPASLRSAHHGAHLTLSRARFFFVTLACCASVISGFAQNTPDYERPPVKYSTTAPRDAVAALELRLKASETIFRGSDRDVLRQVLAALQVPAESQTLVFSRTSFQRGQIRPQRPRALYFSENAYVGWVPGGLIEITTIDPQLGPVFYTFDPASANQAPKIERDADCLRCHGGSFVRDIPAVFARSVFPDAGGEPLLRFGSQVVDHSTPFNERWGGWYVTGYHGSESHRGNVLGAEKDDKLVFELAKDRPDELSAYFDVSPYPSATSDVVALLVLEHQMAVQNSLTRAAFSARRMLTYQHSLQETFKEPVTDEPAYDSVKSVFASAVEDVVDHLLFRGEAPLPEGVVGSDAFRRAFTAHAPRSRAGHALKDLRLRERIFDLRCSYLIYSEFFRGLPPSLKHRILDRLHAVLRSPGANGRYSYLGAEERERIYEILRETHPDAKARWADSAATSDVKDSANARSSGE